MLLPRPFHGHFLRQRKLSILQGRTEKKKMHLQYKHYNLIKKAKTKDNYRVVYELGPETCNGSLVRIFGQNGIPLPHLTNVFENNKGLHDMLSVVYELRNLPVNGLYLRSEKDSCCLNLLQCICTPLLSVSELTLFCE
jgi:hypothetical protein